MPLGNIRDEVAPFADAARTEIVRADMRASLMLVVA